MDTDEAMRQFVDLLSAQGRPGAGNINRFEPLAKQELFLKSQAKNRILFGGNRSGKTHGGVADDVLIMLGKHPYRQHFYGTGPLRIRFIGVDFDRGIDEGAIPKFQQFLPPSALINGSWEDSYRKSEHMLTLANKSTCSFMSYEQNPNKFQIVSLHHVHFDEEPPKAIFDESKMRVLDTAGTWTMTETPVQQLEWVEEDLMAYARAPVGDGSQDIEVFFLNTLENTNLDVDELRALVAGMSVEEQVVRLAGQYRSGSLVFPEFQRRYPYVIPDEAFRLTSEWDVYVGMDHGYANPSAWLWIAAHPDGSIVVFRELYAPGIVVSEWSQMVLDMNASIIEDYGLPHDWEPMGYIGDPAIAQRNNGITGTTVQQEYAKYGIPIATEGIVAARTGNLNIGLDRIHTYLRLRGEGRTSQTTGETNEPWLQILERVSNLQNELKKARKPKQSLIQQQQRNPSEEIRDKDNHAIDALKYPFILVGELRPMDALDDEEFDRERLPEEFRNASFPIETHDDVYANVVQERSGWTLTQGYDYSDLEQM